MIEINLETATTFNPQLLTNVSLRFHLFSSYFTPALFFLLFYASQKYFTIFSFSTNLIFHSHFMTILLLTFLLRTHSSPKIILFCFKFYLHTNYLLLPLSTFSSFSFLQNLHPSPIHSYQYNLQPLTPFSLSQFQPFHHLLSQPPPFPEATFTDLPLQTKQHLLHADVSSLTATLQHFFNGSKGPCVCVIVFARSFVCIFVCVFVLFCVNEEPLTSTEH